MHEWTKVVTSPLGFAGFALFLVFGFLARQKRPRERRWLSRVATVMAFVALLGGISLAYLQARNSSSTRERPNVIQSSSGPGSPNVHDVKGPVTINVDQSVNQPENSKSVAPESKESKPERKKDQ